MCIGGRAIRRVSEVKTINQIPWRDGKSARPLLCRWWNHSFFPGASGYWRKKGHKLPFYSLFREASETMPAQVLSQNPGLLRWFQYAWSTEKTNGIKTVDILDLQDRFHANRRWLFLQVCSGASWMEQIPGSTGCSDNNPEVDHYENPAYWCRSTEDSLVHRLYSFAQKNRLNVYDA